MVKLKEFQAQLDRKLSNASDTQRINFGLDICIRLLPEYKIFMENNSWGDIITLKDSIKLIQEALKDHLSIDNKIDSLLDKVDSVIPDTENFSDWDVSYALNASVSVYELLMYLKDKNYNHILSISSLMTDTIDFKISEKHGNNLSDKEIDNHPLLIDEFKRQLDLIK